MLSEEGEEWKTHRKRFNSGFAPSHILSLLPVVLDKTYTFMKKLDALAASGVSTPLEPYLTNVTFDIVSAHLQRPYEIPANLVQIDRLVRSLRISIARLRTTRFKVMKL
jgi:cytochrome P450